MHMYFNLILPSVMLGPVCVSIELLSTYSKLPQSSVCLSSLCPHRSISNLIQPASIQWLIRYSIFFTVFLFGRALWVRNLTYTNTFMYTYIYVCVCICVYVCVVGLVCVSTDLLATYFKLPQFSVVLVQCVSQ